jgi:NTP pyrophosphatase (non-canonical NTP hydrolase)
MDLREMQKAVYQNKLDKKFNVTDVNLEFCLLYGEVGEAHEAWRKRKPDLGEELADVAIYLLGLSEILGVDLAGEIERKMEINRNRQYKLRNGVHIKVEED